MPTIIFNIQYTIYNIQYTIYNIQYTDALRLNDRQIQYGRQKREGRQTDRQTDKQKQIAKLHTAIDKRNLIIKIIAQQIIFRKARQIRENQEER